MTIKSKAQHFNISKIIFDNISFDTPESTTTYTQNIDVKKENVSEVIEELQNNYSESQKTTNNEIAINILKGYASLQQNQYYTALKYHILNEKRSVHNSELIHENNLANKILSVLIYEKQGAYNLAYTTLSDVTSSNNVENYEIQTYLAYLKLKSEHYNEAFSKFKESLPNAKKISIIDYFYNLYNTSQAALEIGNYKEQLYYAKKADSLINNSRANILNPQINYTYNKNNEKLSLSDLRSQSLINLSVAYRKNLKYDNTIATLNRLIDIEKKSNSKSNVLSEIYVNKALTYTLMKEYNNATYTYYEAIKIFNSFNDKEKLAETYNLLAKNTYLNQEYGQTINLCENSIDISKKNSDYKNLAASYFILSETYAANNDYLNSQKYFKLYNETKENYNQQIQLQKNALTTKDNNTKVLSKQIESEIIESEKQDLELLNTRMIAEQKEQEVLLLKKESELKEKDFINQRLEKEQIEKNLAFIKEQLEKEQLQKNYIKINREREIKILENKNNQNQISLLNNQKAIYQKENELKTFELSENKNRQKLYLVGFALLSTFVISLGYFLLKMRKQNKIIESNNRIIQTTNNQLETNIKQVTEQKAIIEAKNSVIEDSINYSQRIQQSLLIPDSTFLQYFKDAFILYYPKEIVSGDFYMLQNINHKTYLAVVDCTGHGVPGAMIAALAYQELTHLINTPHYNVGAILDDLNTRINELVNSQNLIGSDGMDLMLICVNHQTKKIKYAGAKSSFFMFKNNELIEYKTDKKSIGHAVDPNNAFKYSSTVIDYNEGDLMYLCTDGYTDQFSQIDNKRIGSKNFKLKLNEATSLSGKDQKELFLNYLKTHQQQREQTDDITLIGITL